MKKDERPTLFCVHGGPGLDHHSLLPGINSLQTIFNLKFVDLRCDATNSVETYASQVCEAVGLAKPTAPIGIFGHFFGGHVAMEAMAMAPAFFDFGILCSTVCNMDTIYAKSDMTQRCRRIMAKCLVIGGGQDKIVSPDETSKLARLIHNADAAVIPGAGHFPFLTKPDEFYAIVERNSRHYGK